jgi:hypothetical protein
LSGAAAAAIALVFAGAPALAANATIFEAKPVALGVAEPGEIASAQDTHFYRFDNALKVRDLAVIRLENLSTTLKPDMKVYNADRSQLFERYDGTPGASVDAQLALEPGKPIYVQVLPYGSTGKYSLSVTLKSAFDKYEANEDALSATPMKLGQALAANIMDDKDVDTYRVSGIAQTKVTVSLENQSSTLKPDIKIYNANKSQITEQYNGTPGANLSFEVQTTPGSDIYVQVLPYGSFGKYELSVK